MSTKAKNKGAKQLTDLASTLDGWSAMLKKSAQRIKKARYYEDDEADQTERLAEGMWEGLKEANPYYMDIYTLYN